MSSENSSSGASGATGGSSQYTDYAVSATPFIIPPAPPPDAMGGGDVSVDVNLGSVSIGASFDPMLIDKMIEERERYLARRMVIMENTGVSY